ncbi:hypothetical protein AFLA70_358g001301 [Aspergillus flavus AF70]|nr:hypothetical protein AFLA70_358g001301 [Aspergillus flavus AF70]
MHMASFIWANLNPCNYVGGTRFDSEKDIPNLSGKVILVTGGNSGLGKETVRQIVRHNPQQIFLAARSEQKTLEVIQTIKESESYDGEIHWLPMDLASCASVTNAAEQFVSKASRLDILMLNAGAMFLPPGETSLGHDNQFGINYTGHFLLTKLLLPLLLKTAKQPNSNVRVITLSSIGHTLAPTFDVFMDQQKLKSLDTFARYGASKAANILFAAELARRYPSITSVSVHPGMILTDLYGPLSERSTAVKLGFQTLRFLGSTVAEGVRNQLWAAFGAKKEEIQQGAYYVPVGNHKQGNRYAVDELMGKRLWNWTESELVRSGF